MENPTTADALEVGDKMLRARNGHLTLVFGNRQLVLAIMLLMALMWLFAVVTFLVGRIVFPGPVAAIEEPMEPVIFVDSPLLSDAPATLRMLRSGAGGLPGGETLPPGGLRLAPAPLKASVTCFVDSKPGSWFLEVATANTELAAIYAEYLAGRRIPAFASRNPAGGGAVLMVGPVRDEGHMARLRSDLAQAGLELN